MYKTLLSFCLTAFALALPVYADEPAKSPTSAPLTMSGPLTTKMVAGPAWAKNQPIYEVNLDAYGFPKGTAIREYEKHLPVLKEMGVGLIWFMPLHPRGQKKAFGSAYGVRDYKDINPDLGTKAEFRHLVERAHALGLRVLMDWVPNHTSWDNTLIETHPEYYVRNAQGEVMATESWPDAVQLDYGKPGQWNQPLWNQMRDDMAFWLREFDIDGFRCDVAANPGRVPVEFWNWLRPELEAVKPIFMLAETNVSYVHPAFDMTYAWDLPPVLWDICAGRRPATAIDVALKQEAREFPNGSIRMRFLDNHDWHGTPNWGWPGGGPAIPTTGGMLQVAPLMVLCTTMPGKPLLYNGQEMNFVKVEPLLQAEARYLSPVWPFYQKLMKLYQSQPAVFEGSFTKLVSNNDAKIYAFTRQSGRDRVVVVLNLSDQNQAITLKGDSLAGNYRDWFSDREIKMQAAPAFDLHPWDYRVYVSRAKNNVLNRVRYHAQL